MGNVLLDDYKKDDPLQTFDKWLEQNPQLTGKQILLQNKLFLTSQFKYNSKNIIMKIYFKRDNISIIDNLKSFDIINNLIYKTKCVNILPLNVLNAKEMIKDKNMKNIDKDREKQRESNLIMATRQYLPFTLENKLETRPYLSFNQKKWYIFQMIIALDIVHTQMDLYHGNVRTSNFLATSYEYLFLTDFANYKPNYILEDTEQGLAQFRLFYSSCQNKCTLAPEKLQGTNQFSSKVKKPEYLFNLYQQINNDSSIKKVINLKEAPKNASQDSILKQKQIALKKLQYLKNVNNLKQMDLFSLGICILQVLNNGKNTFTYDNLLSLKKNKFNLQDLIKKVISGQNTATEHQLKQINQIVKDLLLNSKNTNKQDKKQSLLKKFQYFMKDQVFVLLWHCLSSFQKVSFQLSDHRIYLLQNIIEFIEKQIKLTDYKFIMKRAKCLQNFSALKIFTQLIKRKIIYSFKIQPNTILDRIMNSVSNDKNLKNQGKKNNNIIKSNEDIQILEESEQQSFTGQISNSHQRQSFFINPTKNKEINKRLSFRQTDNKKNQKILCPHQFDQEFYNSLIQNQNNSDNFNKKLNSKNFLNINVKSMTPEQRRKNKLLNYLQQQKKLQPLRQEIKLQKSLFYSDYELILKIIFSCIRNCQYVASKMIGIEMINILSKQSKDQTLLRIIIPYLMQLSQDSDINVAKYALNSLIDTFYNFIDPFQNQQDATYYNILINFFLNMIKSSKTRIFMFLRFKQIYNICEWLEIAYLKLNSKNIHHLEDINQERKLSSIKQTQVIESERISDNRTSDNRTSDNSRTSDSRVSDTRVSDNTSSFLTQSSSLNFYKIVDSLKVYYGTFSPKQIQVLMQNVPIAVLPEMFQFYISFLNTQKIMGLKSSLFIAKNALKEFQLQKNIIQVFDNCMESGLNDLGVSLYYSIVYFTLRKNTNLDIVHKIAPHIINSYLWVREQAFNYIKMCLQQFPCTKIFLMFRQIFQPPFPLRIQDLSEKILLPQPLRDIDVDFKQKKYTNKISRKIGLTEEKFIKYLNQMKLNKDNNKNKQNQIQMWQQSTKKFRVQINSVGNNLNSINSIPSTNNLSNNNSAGNPNTNLSKDQIQNISKNMRHTIQQLYENNFFFYIFTIYKKYNSIQRQIGIQKILDDLKKFSKFTLNTTKVTQQQKHFFQDLFQNIISKFLFIINVQIDNNFQNFLTKHIEQIIPDKLKLSLCINLIAEQLYVFNQIKVKPTLNLNILTQGAIVNKSNQQRFFKPKGIQVSQIYENKDQISKLITVGQNFFISVSHDGFMRVYNTKSIQMNIITESEASFQIKADKGEQRVKINDIVCIDNTYTVVLGTNKGQIKGYQIQRLPGGKVDNNRSGNVNQPQLFKYSIHGQIQKLTVPRSSTSSNFNQCISYITSQNILGIQDIRCKQISMKCNIGKERGYCLSLTSSDQNSLLVGTVDGYLVQFDMRFDLVSTIWQMYKDNQAIPITNIIKIKSQRNKFAITYPSNNYQFAQFILQSLPSRIQPTRLYSSTPRLNSSPSHSSLQEQPICSIPYFQNKTNDQLFKLCSNNIMKHIYYSQVSNFDANIKVLDYVSEPLTLKQAKIRDVWSNGCRHRYNQILSIYNKKCLPFLEYMNAGILTNLNPNPQVLRSRNNSQYQSSNTQLLDLCLLTQKRDFSSSALRQSNKSSQFYSSSYANFINSDPSQFFYESYNIDRQLFTKNNKIKITQFSQQENKQFYNCCTIVNGFVVVSNKNNSRIKVFK